MKITLKRPVERINRNVPYRIYLNGKKLTELKNGEEKELELDSAGELCAKISWCGSESLSDLKEGDVVEVNGRVFYSKVLPFLPAILPLLSIFAFKNQVAEFWNYFFTSLLLAMIIGIVAAISVFRKKWIKMQRM